MGRIIAIDYGTRRTGLAVTDPLRIIANALDTVDTKQLEKYLADYFSKNDVDIIVVGKPSQMNGQPSETMRYIEPLAGRLRHASWGTCPWACGGCGPAGLPANRQQPAQ